MMECTKKILSVKKEDIAFLKFILEGYDGLSIMRTLEPKQGLVILHIAPGAEQEVHTLLRALSQEIELHEITPPGILNSI